MTVTFDYYGIGGSRPRSLRSLDAGMADWGALDLAGVVDWLADSGTAERFASLASPVRESIGRLPWDDAVRFVGRHV
jgi:predicted alpha/beta hydrolase